MKILLLFIIIPIVVFTVSCNRCDKKNENYNIAPADKFIYQITDKLVYKNNSGGRDTFEVTDRSSWLGYYPFDGKCSDVGTYVEHFSCSFKDTSSYQSFISFTFNDLTCIWGKSSFHSNGGLNLVTILPEFQLNGNIYKNVYFITNDTILVPTYYAVFGYISKSHGVLSITERNGTIWEFEKLITTLKNDKSS